MTLDGHVKVGLSLAVCVFAMSSIILPDISLSHFELVLLALAVLVGNVFPDFSECNVIPHRTYTHFWLFYVVSGAGCYWMLTTQPFAIGYLLGLGVSFGSLCHILCDWPYYGGCPLFRPRRKVATFRLTFDGGLNGALEYVVVFLCLSASLVVVWPEAQGSAFGAFSAP